jgi:hypothetical protein
MFNRFMIDKIQTEKYTGKHSFGRHSITTCSKVALIMPQVVNGNL